MSKSHHIAKKGGNRMRQSRKRGFLFSEKMVCRFWGVQPSVGCPFLRVYCFGKKAFPDFGTVACIGAKMRMSLF